MKLSLSFIIALTLILSACSEPNRNKDFDFDIIEFDPFSNYESSTDTLLLDINLDKAFMEGICIPSDAKNEYFKVRFQIKNNSGEAKPYSYKVYYQNESYKLPVYKRGKKGNLHYNRQAESNFYGSWNQGDITYRSTQEIPADGAYHEIIDSIRIVGNPRNEAKYLGGNLADAQLTEEQIHSYMKRISGIPEWFGQIKEKAKNNNNSVEEQLYLDARWALQQDLQKGTENNRWKRNPRMGNYSFALVVADANEWQKMPSHFQDITKKDSIDKMYKNPFYYFLHKKTKKEKSWVSLSERTLKVRANYNMKKGVYTNPTVLPKTSYTLDTNAFINTSNQHYQKAQFEQFFHSIDKNYAFENIPVAYDVVGDEYTKANYQENADRFPKEKRIVDHIKNARSIGSTIGYDTKQKAIEIHNPGYNDSIGFRKENVGIKTRHGLSYGKFTAKIQFPDMLSQDQVWNGLTCAFWLVYQEGAWNTKKACVAPPANCKNSKNAGGNQSPTYSEIDIEIVKASKYWPQSSYKNQSDFPVDDGLNNNLIISCTNWDLACKDTKDFNTSVQSINYLDEEYQLHRWDDCYKALTSKHEYPHDLTVGKPIFYQIEWNVDEIIWRIGNDKNDMHVIGYMNQRHTTIPNNQLVAVITQEFHDASWWPLAPFSQNNIPFPLKDLKGYIYELTVE